MASPSKSIERSEQIGGAVFLSIPAFDSFVWALDNYARIELLVRLRDHLPPFLTSPVTGFICTCIGLTLLYLSSVRQLKRVNENASAARRVVDDSGAEYHSTEKPKWLLPVCIGFSIVLLATPILAVAYSLAYKGKAPLRPVGPPPPYFAYNKSELPKRQREKLTYIPPVMAIAPNGIANAAPNFGTQTVNNNAPEPNVSWIQEVLPAYSQGPVAAHGPEALIKLTVDHSMEIPAFMAECDQPCTTRVASVSGGSQSIPFHFDGKPNFTGFIFAIPRPLDAGVQVSWEVTADSGQAPKITAVYKMPRSTLPSQ